MSQRTGWARDLRVRVAGKGVVSHVGSALLRLLGDKVGLTAALSAALKVRGCCPAFKMPMAAALWMPMGGKQSDPLVTCGVSVLATGC